MSQIVLNEPRVCPLIGQGEAAGVAEHVRVSGQGEPCLLAIIADSPPGRLAAEGAAAFADKKASVSGFISPAPPAMP